MAPEQHPGVPRDGLEHHRVRREVCASVLAHVHGRRTGHPRIRNLGHHAIAFIPSSGSVNVLNNDGSARTQKVVSNGVLVSSPSQHDGSHLSAHYAGRDTQLLANFEYRIPIIGPVVLRAFFDAGVDKILRSGQLTSIPRTCRLEHPVSAGGLQREVYIAPGTQKARASTGIELQVMLPVSTRHFACTSLTIPRPCGISGRHRGGPASFPHATFLTQSQPTAAYPFLRADHVPLQLAGRW